MQAVRVRLERARVDPPRDAARAAQLAPLLKAYRGLSPTDPRRRVRWQLEELRVQVFAQELGTAEKVSLAKVAAGLGVKL
jgi:ATP-dependent helicase HrpA